MQHLPRSTCVLPPMSAPVTSRVVERDDAIFAGARNAGRGRLGRDDRRIVDEHGTERQALLEFQLHADLVASACRALVVSPGKASVGSPSSDADVLVQRQVAQRPPLRHRPSHPWVSCCARTRRRWRPNRPRAAAARFHSAHWMVSVARPAAPISIGSAAPTIMSDVASIIVPQLLECFEHLLIPAGLTSLGCCSPDKVSESVPRNG